MTVTLIIFLVLIFLLLGGASYFGYQVFSILLLTLITLIAVSFAEWLYLRKRLITGTIKIPEECPREEMVRMTLPIRLKTRWLPVRIKITVWYGLTDKSVIPQKQFYFRDIRAGDDIELVISVVARHTGKLVLDNLHVEVRTLFGLFKFKRKYRENLLQARTHVLPLPDQADKSVIMAVRQVDSSELARRRVEDRSDEIDTMRAYREGDDIRRIHWPVSSRLNTFVVKQYEIPLTVETHILFDEFTGYSLEDDVDACDRALSRRDRILDGVSGSIVWLLRHGLAVSLHTGLTEKALERLRIDKDPARYRRLLAMIDPDSLPPLGEMITNLRGQYTRDRFLLFSSRISEETAAAMIRLRQTAYQIIFFYYRAGSQTRAEENALRMIRQAMIEVIEIHGSAPAADRIRLDEEAGDV